MYSDNGHPHPPTHYFPSAADDSPCGSDQILSHYSLSAAVVSSVYVCVIAKKEIICAMGLGLRYIDGKTFYSKGCVKFVLSHYFAFVILEGVIGVS